MTADLLLSLPPSGSFPPGSRWRMKGPEAEEERRGPRWGRSLPPAPGAEPAAAGTASAAGSGVAGTDSADEEEDETVAAAAPSHCTAAHGWRGG